jgi:hypothetical protein
MPNAKTIFQGRMLDVSALHKASLDPLRRQTEEMKSVEKQDY